MSSSIANQRSSPPLESHVRTGSVSSTVVVVELEAGGRRQLRGRRGGQLADLRVDVSANPRSTDQRARRPAVSSASMARS